MYMICCSVFVYQINSRVSFQLATHNMRAFSSQRHASFQLALILDSYSELALILAVFSFAGSLVLAYKSCTEFEFIVFVFVRVAIEFHSPSQRKIKKNNNMRAMHMYIQVMPI